MPPTNEERITRIAHGDHISCTAQEGVYKVRRGIERVDKREENEW